MTEFTGGARCPVCGKVRFLSRSTARKAAKNLNRRVPGHLNAYRCGEFWHIGHLPSAVIAGDQSRAELDKVPKRHMGQKAARDPRLTEPDRHQQSTAPGEGAR